MRMSFKGVEIFDTLEEMWDREKPEDEKTSKKVTIKSTYGSSRRGSIQSTSSKISKAVSQSKLKQVPDKIKSEMKGPE